MVISFQTVSVINNVKYNSLPSDLVLTCSVGAWMTLNGVIALILRFSQISIYLLAKYVAVVEYRSI